MMRAAPRRAAIVLALLALGPPTGTAPARADPAPGLEEVALDIVNRTEAPIRCVVVLAHFVTRDLEETPSGGTRTLVMERLTQVGTLAYGAHDGEPMFVENILCGAVAGWEGRHTDLDLSRLRSGGDRRYQAECILDGRLRCPIAPGTPE